MLHTLHYIAFWLCVILASGSYLKKTDGSWTIGNDNPQSAIAYAILAYTLRPW